MVTEFTPYMSFFGGVLIGLSAVILMGSSGRIAGISGIVGGLFSFDIGGALWRIAFLVGLIGAPFVFTRVSGITPEFAVNSDVALLVAGGLLVGFGASLGNGCTSGHGICGLSRLSKRSFVSVCVFMATAIVTVFVTRHVL